MKACKAEGCAGELHARSYCKHHYQIVRRGTALGVARLDLLEAVSPEDRFWSRVDKTGECWIWGGYTTDSGYGAVKRNNASVPAHRYAYEITRGTIPDGLCIDHVCHTPACVNPDHLRTVTSKQNAEHRAGAQKNSQTGIRGVSPHRSGKGWIVTAQHNGKVVRAGRFHNIDEAEKAAIALRNELFTHNSTDRNTLI